MYPKLDDVVKADDVSTKGGGKFAASYVNWAKISHLLREHAPGWQPITKPAEGGGMLHTAPDGSYYMLLGFESREHGQTVFVPHAVMDHQMKPKKNPDSRDISDAFVRGMCKAAAMLFGLGWRLWSKDDPFERETPAAPVRRQATPANRPKPQPDAEPFDSVEHALEALGRCTMIGEIEAWAPRVKVSQFQGVDLENLREATKERRATIAA